MTLPVTQISRLGRIVTGKTPSTKHPEFFGGRYPFITPTDIKNDLRIVETERFLSEQGEELLKNYLLPTGTVCFVCIGATIGKLCLTTQPSFTNQQINSIIVDEFNHDNKYVYYLLRYNVDSIKPRAGGAATPIINKTAFSAVQLPVHPLSAQRKIASILSAYDDLIENSTRRIKILEEMSQAIYREWFVNFRFPGHEKVKMVESELGMIPEGWEVRSLTELVETQYGITKSTEGKEVGPKFVRGMDINKASYIDWLAVPYCEVDEAELDKYRLFPGDILIIRMADPGKVAIIEKKIKAVFGSYLIRLKIGPDKVSPYYLFHFLLAEKYQNYITGASTGTTRKSASARVITDIVIVLPPKVVLAEFEEQIRTTRELLNVLLDKNSILRRTRDLLLPKLISGELDVSDLDIKTELVEK